MRSAQEVLDHKGLHEFYHANYDPTQKLIHDRNCPFCHYEDRVLEAMEEYKNEAINELKSSSYEKEV